MDFSIIKPQYQNSQYDFDSNFILKFKQLSQTKDRETISITYFEILTMSEKMPNPQDIIDIAVLKWRQLWRSKFFILLILFSYTFLKLFRLMGHIGPMVF